MEKRRPSTQFRKTHRETDAREKWIWTPENAYSETQWTRTARELRLTKKTPGNAAALAALKAHKARQAEEKLSLGPYWEEHGLIFPALGGTPLSLPNLDRRHYKPILKAANLPPMPLYSMRHTAATLLLKSGANLKDVQDRLGHARAELTLNVYLESDMKSQRDATAKLAAALAG